MSDKLRLAQSQGGEGGEGGEAGLSPGEADVQFLADLTLIRGHHAVGKELVELGRWDDAVVHFLHPSQEIYADIVAGLVERGIAPFGDTLVLLATVVKAKDAEAFAARFRDAEVALDAAEGRLADNAGTLAKTIVSVLDTAAEEYQGAIEDGVIANPVEYQDSRGFVTVADSMLVSLSNKVGADATAGAVAAMADLKRAWPDPVPPQKPVMSIGEVLAAVSTVELALSGIE